MDYGSVVGFDLSSYHLRYLDVATKQCCKSLIVHKFPDNYIKYYMHIAKIKEVHIKNNIFLKLIVLL